MGLACRLKENRVFMDSSCVSEVDDSPVECTHE